MNEDRLGRPEHPDFSFHVPKKTGNRKLSIFIAAAFGFVLLLVIIIAIASSQILPFLTGGRVALLEVNGAIYDARPLVEELHKYRDNPSVKAIVVRLDTPGGSAAASQELYEEMNKIRRGQWDKPIVASMGNVAASGGYYVACGADEIFANPGTLTGSIGVIMNLPNFQKLVRKVGIRFEVIKSGEHKDIGSSVRPISEEERLILQGVINDVYHQFVDDIYATRHNALESSYSVNELFHDDNITTDPVKNYLLNLADGRIFSGKQAFEYGLVDSMGNLEDAVQRAGKLAGIEGKPEVYQIKKKVGLLDMLQGGVKQSLRQFAPTAPSLEFRFVP